MKSQSLFLTANMIEKISQNDLEKVPIIRKADLENHNCDGGLWVVIHGKVYDVHDFKTSAPCGEQILSENAGD